MSVGLMFGTWLGHMLAHLWKKANLEVKANARTEAIAGVLGGVWEAECLRGAAPWDADGSRDPLGLLETVKFFFRLA